MKKRLAILPLIFLIITTCACMSVLLLSWWAMQMPGWAEQSYGPHSPALSQLERIYLSTRLMQQSNDLKSPTNQDGAEQEFKISLGESTDSISQRLQTQGLIPNANALRDYLVYSGLDTSLQAGEYRLSPQMTPLDIAKALQDATPGDVVFNILPGWRMEEIAEALPTSGLNINPDDFKAAISNPSPEQKARFGLPDVASLEGFLFPDSYLLPRDTSTQAFITVLLENFGLKIDNELSQGFAQSNLNLNEAVILASIVQREAVVEEEMPQIASVFLNRLRDGMKLEADPTVQYALGYNQSRNSWWTVPLSQSDLQIDSPYNTYLYSGLPPAPISNPGFSALRAIAFPAQTPYYYFRAACDDSGLHVFSKTYEQHAQNACP